MTNTLLSALGWDDARAAELRAAELRAAELPDRPEPAEPGGSAIPGRVVRVERGLVRVATETETLTLATTEASPAVGDWVLTDGRAVLASLPRRTELRRKEAGQTSGEQVLAANVDVVVVVEPMDPRPSVRRVERMVTLAWASGATPLVVLTKSDLGDGSEVAAVQSVAHGVDVLAVSAEAGTGLDELRTRLRPGQTFVLLGPSGAGKSTLVNALAGREVLVTASVRGDGRGRHTTTHRELVVVPGVAVLIDTPGIRGVGLVADEEGLDLAFDDVVSLAEECRFADCSHVSEPGCAVLRAIEEGELAAARLTSYRHLLREIAHQSARKGAQDRSALRALGRQRARTAREAMSAKGR